MPIRMRMIVMTIINSIIVNPASNSTPRRFLNDGPLVRIRDNISISNPVELPIRILGPIERRTRRLRVYVKHVLAAPARRIRIVLNGTQPPFGLPGHGVHWNLSQKTNLPVAACAELDSLHQRFQVRWIAFAPDFHANLIPVGRIFVTVDRILYLPEVVVKLRFFLPNDGVLGDGQCGGRQNEQYCARNDQLQQRHPALGKKRSPADSSAAWPVVGNVAQHRSHNLATAGLAAPLRWLSTVLTSAANLSRSPERSTGSMSPAPAP